VSALLPGQRANAKIQSAGPADRRSSADFGHRLRDGTIALRHLWRGFHRSGTAGGRDREVCSQRRRDGGLDPKRKGTFTSNLLAYVDGRPLALYFTGWQHAGENLGDVLRLRSVNLEPPIQMCDALSRNLSLEFTTILAHCLSHARREFVTVAPSFPDECRHVLQSLGQVYRVDAQAKELEMNPEQRLVHHQTHSRAVMEQLRAWIHEQMEAKEVEPNSGLGQAIAYLLKHWEPLTLFLRKAGTPLDNNRCEQALKMAILHRKNSLSYKTLNGARTGDLFMSLIHTCRLNQINPFEYLLAIATQPDAVKLVPQAWLPWNYPKSETTSDTS
jgi:transposase